MAKTNHKQIAETQVAEVAAKRGRAIDPNSKVSKAAALFAECYAMEKVPQRKDIIDRAVQEIGLTKQGAATYLHNYRNKNGMVKHKTAE